MGMVVDAREVVPALQSTHDRRLVIASSSIVQRQNFIFMRARYKLFFPTMGQVLETPEEGEEFPWFQILQWSTEEVPASEMFVYDLQAVRKAIEKD